jgi:hypothetical protein
MPRLASLDRLRAAALTLMLLHHFTKWLAGDPRHILPGWEGFAFTDVCAPAFAAAAGASAWLFAEGRLLKGESQPRVLATVARRYLLLIPIGIILQDLAAHTPWDWGVLQTLGAGVFVTVLLTRVVPPLPLAVAALVTGPIIELHFAGHPGYIAEMLGSTFPVVTYTGFALFGAAGARLLVRNPDRGKQAIVAGLVLVELALVLGQAPDRYPGGVSFIIPGLAGTLLLYGIVDRWQALPRSLGSHTLGIFLAHYVAFYAINRFGLRHALSPLSAVLVGVLAITFFAVVAPHVPPLPWSPRTGRRRSASQDQKRVASSAAYLATTASVAAVR